MQLATYIPQFEKVFDRTPQLSNIKPSDWAEQHIMIPNKGRLNYDFNPYCKEIINRMAPDDPARKITVMKGSQITFSSGVIMPIIGYIIAEDPHNTYLMVGTADLVPMAGVKLDEMIHGAGLQDYIGYQIKRKKNNKSGDTDEIKYFANGYIRLGAATNHKSIAQVDLTRVLLDDLDAMAASSKDAGSFLDLIEMRGAASLNTYKQIEVGTPLLKEKSLLEPSFNNGDKRYYMLECPCCHEPIMIRWEVKEGDLMSELTGEKAACRGGIVFESDEYHRVIKKSVGYVCYKCGGFFNDRNKQNMLRAGFWQPTAVAKSERHYSYHISSLYAPVGMNDWAHYAQKWLEAHPKGQARDEKKYQVLANTCFGQTYEGVSEELKAISLLKNKRDYDVEMVPDKLSMADGNGRIILLTMGSDMNGKIAGINGDINDARLDWEILAHSESGATYSICHGSIGTFVRGEKDSAADRVRWTYEHNKPNSVWPEFDKLRAKKFVSDTGREFRIGITGLDCGFGAKIGAYPYLDKRATTTTWGCIVGLKGDKEKKYVPDEHDSRIFIKSRERPSDMYMVEVGIVKDRLSQYMKLRWDRKEPQPPFFMNYPRSSKGLYEYENYFEHYESEKRAITKDKDDIALYRWEKKNSMVNNHMWDCRIYNISLREIFLSRLATEYKVKELKWEEFVDLAKKIIK